MPQRPPARDVARLAALRAYGILDTPREQDFDEVAELASAICGTPIAVVNLVGDGRQFFKAEVGLGVRETPLETSFCAKAILEEEFLVVPDATKEARFAGNPLVTDAPHLKFYAGALLRTGEGHAIGTVCVLDYQPRELSATQRQTLRVLARQVMALLELRRTVRNQTLALEAGAVGTFDLDVESDIMLVSPEFCRLFGLAPAASFPASALEGIVVRDDADVRSDPARRRDGSAEADVEYRIRRPDEEGLRWIARRARFVRDGSGAVVRMLGTVHDVTDAKRRQAQQAALLALGDRLRGATTEAEVGDAAAATLGRTLAASRAGYARVDAGPAATAVAGEWTAPGTPPLAGHRGFAGVAAAVSTAGEVPTVVADVDAAGDAQIWRAMGVRAHIAVPLVENGTPMGVLFVHQGAPRRWFGDEVDFAKGVADRAGAALAKVGAEAQRRFLQAELSHRLKNTLAIVQAIANQTLRRVPDREPVEALERRIHALSTAHDVLLQQSFAAVPLADVVRSVLATFGAGERIAAAGPDVTLGPRATLGVSLLLHELGTNAVKYGALSAPGGVVSIAWRRGGPAGEELVFSWVESGGPPVAPPSGRKGFGSRLIGMGLVGTGGAELRYPSSGFSAEFRAPLAEVQRS